MRALLFCFISIVLNFGVAYADNKLIQKQFNELDRDLSGFISQDEVQSQPNLVRFMNLYYQDSFLMADINQDGVLDLDELFAYEEEISAE
jgi:Ca2+-binding EF-hand superfamily protein